MNLTELVKNKEEGNELLKNSYVVGSIAFQQLRIKEKACERALSANETCYEVNYNSDTMMQTTLDSVTMSWREFTPAEEFEMSFGIYGHYGKYD